MEFHTLFVYHGLEELRKIQEEREVFPFVFGIKDMIDACPEICIDISALIYYLQVEKNNIQPAYINFSEMTSDLLLLLKLLSQKKLYHSYLLHSIRLRIIM